MLHKTMPCAEGLGTQTVTFLNTVFYHVLHNFKSCRLQSAARKHPLMDLQRSFPLQLAFQTLAHFHTNYLIANIGSRVFSTP